MNLIEQAENFVVNLFKDKLSNSYTYHNITHTSKMVVAVITIADDMNLSAADKEVLLLAA